MIKTGFKVLIAACLMGSATSTWADMETVRKYMDSFLLEVRRGSIVELPRLAQKPALKFANRVSRVKKTLQNQASVRSYLRATLNYELALVELNNSIHTLYSKPLADQRAKRAGLKALRELNNAKSSWLIGMYLALKADYSRTSEFKSELLRELKESKHGLTRLSHKMSHGRNRLLAPSYRVLSANFYQRLRLLARFSMSPKEREAFDSLYQWGMGKMIHKAQREEIELILDQ